jgi:hypothetical protein
VPNTGVRTAYIAPSQKQAVWLMTPDRLPTALTLPLKREFGTSRRGQFKT